MDFEKMEEAGFEGNHDTPDIFVLGKFTHDWDLYVRVSQSGRAGEIWLKNVYTDEEISLEKAPATVYRKALKILDEAGL